MKIAVVGRGGVGGGLADLWEKAGHDIIARFGKEGGDVSEADVVLLAVPGGAIAEALDKVQGIAGKTVIDASYLIGREPPAEFDSNAQYVKSRTNGPTAKSFNLNFAKPVRQAQRGEVEAVQCVVGRRCRPPGCRAVEPRCRLRAGTPWWTRSSRYARARISVPVRDRPGHGALRLPIRAAGTALIKATGRDAAGRHDRALRGRVEDRSERWADPFAHPRVGCTS